MRLTEKMLFADRFGNRLIQNRSGYIADRSTPVVEVESPAYFLPNVRLDVEYIGAYSWINHDTEIRNTSRIGRFSLFGPCCIISAPEHPVSFASAHISFMSKDYFPSSEAYLLHQDQSWAQTYFSDWHNWYTETSRGDRKTVIGNDVWFGRNVLVMRGIHVGDGAIVCAGSVVTKDVPPYTIVGGNPAKVIRQRFSDEMVEKFIEIKWWEYGPDILHVDGFTSPDMDFLKRIEERIANGYPKLSTDRFRFDHTNGQVIRINAVDGTETLVYEQDATIEKGGISDQAHAYYNRESGMFTIKGWFLPSYAYDSVRIYLNGEQLGTAQTHVLRPDVLTNYPQYDSARSGWNFSKKIPAPIGTIGYIICELNGKQVCTRRFELVVVDSI